MSARSHWKSYNLIDWLTQGYLKDQNKAKALVGFLNWAATDGQQLAASLDYAPLSAGVAAKVKEAIATLQWSGRPLASAAR